VPVSMFQFGTKFSAYKKRQKGKPARPLYKSSPR
jgi:hypothetical protein